MSASLDDLWVFPTKEGLIVALLTFFFLRICVSDYRERKILNRHVLWVLVLSLCVPLLYGWDLDTILRSFYQAGIVLIFGFVLFLLRVCGAGDIKLMAAVSLGIAVHWWQLFLFSTLFLGGLIGAGMLLVRRLKGEKNIRHPGVPYALAICPAAWCGIVLTMLSTG